MKNKKLKMQKIKKTRNGKKNGQNQIPPPAPQQILQPPSPLVQKQNTPQSSTTNLVAANPQVNKPTVKIEKPQVTKILIEKNPPPQN